MAQIYPTTKTQKSIRVSYNVKFGNQTKRLFRRVKSMTEAKDLHVQLEMLEQSIRVGVARAEDISDWIDRGWITVEIAQRAFRGYAETVNREQAIPNRFDRLKLLAAYGEHLARESNGRKCAATARGRAAIVVE